MFKKRIKKSSCLSYFKDIQDLDISAARSLSDTFADFNQEGREKQPEK